MTAAIYLDYAATTPVDPAVARAMASSLAEAFGNPSSTHAFGRAAAAQIDRARAQVAALVGADAEQIVFTSGATESNNLAVLGVARANADRGRHLVTSRIEHKSVLDAFRRLEKEGFRVTWLAPDTSGRIDPDTVRAALRPDTVLVSVMHVSNEIGVIQDIEAIGRACRGAGVAFHTDAAQSVGRITIDARRLPVDLMSLTSHKIYGPKGVGALYLGQGARALVGPQMFGGGQERGLRPGTLPTHQVVGFGVAAELVRQELSANCGESDGKFEKNSKASAVPARITALRDRLWEGLARLPDVHLNGAAAPRVPHVLNVAFEGVDGESLIEAVAPLAVSSGAACSSASGDPSHVLRALGRGSRLAESSVRFSFGRFTTAAEVDAAAALVRRAVRRLRGVSPQAAKPGKGAAEAEPTAAAAADSEAGAAADPTARVDVGSSAWAVAALAGDIDSPSAGLIVENGADAASSENGVAAGGLRGDASRLFRELPHAGVIPDEAGCVLRGEAGGPTEEVWVRFHLLMDGDTVKDARFEALGCPHTLAAAAWVASRLPGRRRGEGAPEGPQAWARALGAPVEKLGRLLVIEDAVNACLGVGHSEADRR